MHETLGFWHYMFSPVGASWYSGAFWSNQTQWTVIWIPTLYVAYKHTKCKTCWRIGKIKVKGTHYKTCVKHSNPADHTSLQALHKAKHPELHKFLKGVK